MSTIPPPKASPPGSPVENLCRPHGKILLNKESEAACDHDSSKCAVRWKFLPPTSAAKGLKRAAHELRGESLDSLTWAGGGEYPVDVAAFPVTAPLSRVTA